ncbi:MAG: ATP-binding cassette domain-containing protein [Candidatus Bathyarchaeia archaeon]
MSGNSDDVVLRVVGLTKYFGAIKALENVSFDVRRGEILAIVGDNGAGKSTLLKILSGVLQPTSGEVYLDGRKVNFRDPQDAMRHGIAIAHQVLHEQLIDKRLVWENFFAGRELVKKMGPISILDKKTMKTHIRKLVEKFNLTINEDKKIGQLSEEERQMLTILKALDQNPQILLLDESFTFLSLRRASEIVKLLKNIRENYKCSILFVSHDMMLVKSLADKILILRNGKMVFFGKSQEITLEGIVRYIRGK